MRCICAGASFGPVPCRITWRICLGFRTWTSDLPFRVTKAEMGKQRDAGPLDDETTDHGLRATMVRGGTAGASLVPGDVDEKSPAPALSFRFPIRIASQCLISGDQSRNGKAESRGLTRIARIFTNAVRIRVHSREFASQRLIRVHRCSSVVENHPRPDRPRGHSRSARPLTCGTGGR